MECGYLFKAIISGINGSVAAKCYLRATNTNQTYFYTNLSNGSSFTHH